MFGEVVEGLSLAISAFVFESECILIRFVEIILGVFLFGQCYGSAINQHQIDIEVLNKAIV